VANSINTKKKRQKRWLKLAIYAVALIALSIGLYYVLQYLQAHFDITTKGIAPIVYLLVFATTLICNASIIFPVYFYMSIMMTAATNWDPVLIALTASIAGALGEIVGYYAGRLGKKIVSVENTPGYTRIAAWMNRYGPLAVFLFSLQPVLPFDIAGLISGAAKMPLWKFLIPCWAGKFPKYLLLCYFSVGILHFLPPWFN